MSAATKNLQWETKNNYWNFFIGGEWLNELEKNVEDRNALAYKTLQAVKSSSDDAKENVLAGLTKLTPLSSLIASQDVRKAFKPVRIQACFLKKGKDLLMMSRKGLFMQPYYFHCYPI